jgi:hypothetical protein
MDHRIQLASIAMSRIMLEDRIAARHRDLVIANMQTKVHRIKYMIDAKKYRIDLNHRDGLQTSALVTELQTLLCEFETAAKALGNTQLAMIEDSAKPVPHKLKAYAFIDSTIDLLKAPLDTTVPAVSADSARKRRLGAE